MTAPITCFTALIDIAEDEQCEELEDFLRGKGAQITSTNDTELLPRLQHIIDNSHVVFQQRDIPQQELEGFFYSVVSLFHIVTPDQANGIVQSFCDKLAAKDNEENINLRLRLLGLVFCHFPDKDPLRYIVFCNLVRLAGRTSLTGSLQLDMDKVCKWTELWELEAAKKREMFLLLWGAYQNSTDLKLSSRILTELLSTYSSTDAPEADPTLVERLVVLVISDSTQFVFDHLISLPALTALKTHNIYKLLYIFVAERLSSFMTFYQENKDFVSNLGLQESYCVEKMRQLTLVSLAMETGEIPFSRLAEELHLPENQLEQFVINAVRLKLIEARINQTSKTLVIRTSIYRTFGSTQWKLLHDRLSSWQQCVNSVKTSLNTVKT
ncbi:eukaryotic translation initiation factor 3 subunit M-like [Halichondria panicea]|uniref:eukaryotic translation initiation factor 3 subunit M-like n=1 Tax=Halichondria panicea TaxID=6063 RepID=UPI00312B64EC